MINVFKEWAQFPTLSYIIRRLCPDMTYSKTEKYALKISEEAAKAHGYEIYDVEYVKEGPHWFLRVFIDRESGVSLDDCEIISNMISARLDKDDFIKGSYFLEVSSPGLERMLRSSHFEKAIGKRIAVAKKDGKTINGILTASSDSDITLDENIIISKNMIKKANILFDFMSEER